MLLQLFFSLPKYMLTTCRHYTGDNNGKKVDFYCQHILFVAAPLVSVLLSIGFSGPALHSLSSSSFWHHQFGSFYTDQDDNMNNISHFPHFDVTWLNYNFYIYFVAAANQQPPFNSFPPAAILLSRLLILCLLSLYVSVWCLGPSSASLYWQTLLDVSKTSNVSTHSWSCLSDNICTYSDATWPSLDVLLPTYLLSPLFPSLLFILADVLANIMPQAFLQPLQRAPTRLFHSHHTLLSCSGLLTPVLQSFTFFIMTLGHLCNRPLGCYSPREETCVEDSGLIIPGTHSRSGLFSWHLIFSEICCRSLRDPCVAVKKTCFWS